MLVLTFEEDGVSGTVTRGTESLNKKGVNDLQLANLGRKIHAYDGGHGNDFLYI